MGLPNSYEQKQQVRCTGTWTTPAGVAMDPTTVIFKFMNPAGTITTYTYGEDSEVIKSGTGIYYVDIDADSSGTWHYRFESSGSGKASEENSFTVRESEFD